MKGFSNTVQLCCRYVLLLAALLAAPAALAQTQKQSPATSGTKQTLVDVNSADEKTLETLPGIGPTLATRIIAGRPYSNLTDLGKVKGLSQSKLNAIKDDVTFGPSGSTTKKSTKKTTASTSTEQSTQPPRSSGAVTPPSGGSTTPQQTTPSATGRSSSTKLAPGQKVNINTATAEELDALPGIGPTKAQAIIDYRNQHGDFKDIEDIQNVKGIKAGEFSKLKDYIVTH
jgi:competence protein ComEA